MQISLHKSVIQFSILSSLLCLVPPSVLSNDAPFEYLWVPGTVCSAQDLDHSTLVERNELTHNVPDQLIWPQRNQVKHIFSSRSGERSVVKSSMNLNHKMSPQEQLLNINTTLKVFTNSKLHELHGFGSMIDPSQILDSQGNIHKSAGVILKELLSPSSQHFTLIGLKLEKGFVAKNNIAYVLREIDKLLELYIPEFNKGDKLRIIFSIEGMDETQDIIDVLRGVWNGLEASIHLECWGMIIDKEWVFSNPDSSLFIGDIRSLLSTNNLFSMVGLEESPSFADRLAKENGSFNGLLVKSALSQPYSVIEYLRNKSDQFVILSVGTERTKLDIGDWDNAKNFAVQILNHLKHGSNGFLEPRSWSDLLDFSPTDTSIYNLDDNSRFLGPMFYAIGHFSRFLMPGSRVLKSELYTSPNMFAGQFASFLTPEKDYVVAVVINDNEHIMPFQLVVDDLVVTQLDIWPKSFNTILTRIK